MKISRIDIYTIVIIVFISVFLSIGASVYRNKSSLSTITYGYGKEIFSSLPKGEILKGQRVIGEFRSKDNNLGIIALRFKTFGKVKTDRYIFKLKEKESKTWYYENNYKAKDFGGYPLFPFGFPIIENSKNKEYVFELTSQKGKKGDAVEILQEDPVLETRHKYSIQGLKKNTSEISHFVFSKTREVFDYNFFTYLLSCFFILVIIYTMLRFLPLINISKVSRNSYKYTFALNFGSGKYIKRAKKVGGNAKVFIHLFSIVGIIVLQIVNGIFFGLFYILKWLKKE